MGAWLVKTEPDEYSIHDLARDGQVGWEGVRNYAARNHMRDGMQPGDRVLIYHSSTRPTGVVGVAEVVGPARADPSQFKPDSPYFDPKASPEAPRWMLRDLAFVEELPRMVTLAEIKDDPALHGIPLAKKGQRLSVMPIEEVHFERIVQVGRGGG